MKKLHHFRDIINIAFIVIILISCNSRYPENNIIGLNQNIHHDDFEYSVTNFIKAKEIGEGETKLVASGNFYLISFKVENNAKRVDHPWDNSIAYIVDENGKEYENNLPAQKKLTESSSFGWIEKHVTSPGSSDTAILVFDIPEAIKTPYLKIKGETLMGDVFDGGKFRKMKIKLF
ncbi:MAG TPA: DUF4352 domain-containing protein [Saprospiraceae bacterium]|nr:DUF4352 domain-containing protein [Saprospiraceae bacterium]